MSGRVVRFRSQSPSAAASYIQVGIQCTAFRYPLGQR